MADKPENPPAFPRRLNGQMHEDYKNHEGITLRDYFAAKALVGLLTAPGTDGNEPFDLNNGAHICGLATDAYKIADAMLIARND